MKEKIKMHYAPGRGVMVHKLNTVSTQHLKDFRRESVRAIDQELQNRKIIGEQPSFFYKLRRLFHRLWLTYRHRIDVMCDLIVDLIVGTPSAADIEYIGLEDGR